MSVRGSALGFGVHRIQDGIGDLTHGHTCGRLSGLGSFSEKYSSTAGVRGVPAVLGSLGTLRVTIVAAAAAGQEIDPASSFRIVRGLVPDRGGSGGAGERRDRGESFGTDVAQTGAGGHDQFSLLLVFGFVFVLGGLIPLPTPCR